MADKDIRAFIALGANLGNPLQQLDTAAMAIGAHKAITRVAMSPIYKSVPHGVKNQPDFTNAVLEIRTTLSPLQLLAVLQAIETTQGRERKVRWGARTLDLDIILFGDTIWGDGELTIPHPRTHQREFVIKPLYDLDKSLKIPPHGTVADLIQHLPLENLSEMRPLVSF